MKHKRIYDSGVYQYLEAAGVLGRSPEDIKAARRTYWNMRKCELKKIRHAGDKEFTVYLGPKELAVISENARLHEISRSQYIKLAALSYAGKKYLVPRNEDIYKVKALLSLNYSMLQELYERRFLNKEDGEKLTAAMQELQREVLQLLFNPKAVRDDH